MKCFVLALCALGTESAPVDDPIPFSGASSQKLGTASSDDLIKSFRRQKPATPELPAVIPSGSHLPDRIPAKELQAPLEPSRSHLHPRFAQQLTEQNSTQKSVGSESSSQPNDESIDQSHHVTPKEDSQLKSDSVPPGIPGQVAVLQVQVREIFPERNSPVTSAPELPRPNLSQSIQLPSHVHEVPEEDSPEPRKPGPDQPQHGPSVQLPKHVHEAPEEDAPEPIKPGSIQPELDPSSPQTINLGSDQPQPLADLQHGRSVQLPKHVHEVVPEEESSESIKTGPDQPKHGQSQLPKHVQELPEKDPSHPIFKPRLTPPRYGQFVSGKEGLEEDTPQPITPGSDQPQHGQSDQLLKHVQEVPEEGSPEPVYNPTLSPPWHNQLVQLPEDRVLQLIPLIPETKLSNSAQSVQQFPNLQRPEHDTPLKAIPEPVRQNSGISQQLPKQVSIEQQDMPSSIVPEAPPLPNFDRSLHIRDDLSVPHSGYTEAYDIEWHKETNTARTVIENSTTIYRKLLPDGRIQYLEIKSDRANGSHIRLCTTSPPLVPTSSVDTAFPGLPELGRFQFAGYTNEEGRSQVEHWQYIVFGRPGQGGAAREESVNVTHDFFSFRDGGETVPLRYTVTKDSSVLGPSSDTYTHRYSLLSAPTAAILPDTTRECDVLDELKEDTNRRRRTAGTRFG